MLKSEVSLKADMESILEQAQKSLDEGEIEPDMSVIEGFSAYVDIMGEIQIVGNCDQIEDLYEAGMDAYEANNFSRFQKKIEKFNDAYSLAIHFDNSVTVQANAELEAYKDDDYYWDEESYYVRPVLVFADDSRWCIEDYFTESSFGDLVEAVEDLYDDFEKMFERYF